jgi:hypothetical protein
MKGKVASFWLNVLTDLKASGVEDILIACTDGYIGDCGPSVSLEDGPGVSVIPGQQ